MLLGRQNGVATSSLWIGVTTKSKVFVEWSLDKVPEVGENKRKKKGWNAILSLFWSKIFFVIFFLDFQVFVYL